MGRCQAKERDGRRCAGKAPKGLRFCGRHRPDRVAAGGPSRRRGCGLPLIGMVAVCGLLATLIAG